MTYVNPYPTSLNDRANAAAGRERAHQQVMSAWELLAERRRRTESRAYPVFDNPGALKNKAKPHTKTPKPDKPTATPSRSTSQWEQYPGGRNAAYAEYADTLTKYGFDRGEVMSWLKGLSYTQMQNPALVTQAFRETPMWQQRFGAVTKARQGNGMSYLNEGQIIQLEDTYRQIFTAAGIPKQYWERNDLHDLIAQDVSPQEVADRVKLAEDAVNNTDPQYVRSFRDFYGIKKKDLVGYMLNRKKGVQVLDEQVKAAEIGAEALGTGLDSVGKRFAERLVDKDISRQEARQAFSTVADTEQDWKKLAALSGEKISEKGLIKDELGLDKDGKVGKKKRRLASQERARFGNMGAGTGAMGSSSSGAY